MKKNNKIIYLDNASATPLDKEVLAIMKESLQNDFYNPSAISEGGLLVKKKIEDARDKIAYILGVSKNQILFTSGATESNNLTILGIYNTYKNKFKKLHFITTKVEHASVLEVFKNLEKNTINGESKIEVTYLDINPDGNINLDELKKSLKPNTVLVSIMYANNEIGTIYNIREIAKTLRHFRKNKKQDNNLPYLHTDATQAINYLDINVNRLGVDMMSFNSAKIYGPKGVGVLYVKKDTKLEPITFGGNQEYGLRPGTLNAPLILGLTKALEITNKIKDKEVKRLEKLKNKFFYDLEKVFMKNNLAIKLNGNLENSLPNILNITVPKIPSDLFLVELSMRGIYLSEKSACKTGEKKNSHVLEALYKNQNQDLSSLRFSLGRENTKEDLKYVIDSINDILKKLKIWYI